jgi:hypothetical protein
MSRTAFSNVCFRLILMDGSCADGSCVVGLLAIRGTLDFLGFLHSKAADESQQYSVAPTTSTAFT